MRRYFAAKNQAKGLICSGQQYEWGNGAAAPGRVMYTFWQGFRFIHG